MKKKYVYEDGSWTQLDPKEISENGSYDVKDIDSVDVEVSGGGGDFSTAEVQVTFAGRGLSLVVPIASDGDSSYSSSGIYQSGTYQVILYKGTAWAEVWGHYSSITVSGDAEVGEEAVTITGDCSITITSNVSPD